MTPPTASGPIASGVPGRGDYAGRSHAQYRRARSHTRLVRVLKILLPLSAALIVIAFVVVSWFDNLVPQGIGIESVAILDGKLVMQSPVMSGQTSDANPYTLRADKAIQDLDTPDIIVLEDIVADLPVSNGDKAVLNAVRGTYDRAGQTMVFKQPFTVNTEAGMQVRLQSADIDLANSTLVSETPVSISSGDASVVAQSMQIQDKGRIIIFQDKVRMTINPSALKSKDGATN
ncbi:LPS export ABC transporter periplasmic protein LptC [Hoeflea sp. YIM 152468]|uniref:LPS export ABC transporter periplasmic protein LptC n=1 Tax=Hoeflea sp. YIM 152468 TaxID=3031759 RepID=UPI0023DA631C|nr:LPS export ABC transporter periplasmic protein LptC [Hoeflea sp. YIM 152468]MDF1608313.1 LPS export ABC transporter periplasmic protein LptC [Hoeflea sp. YIM 152468]